MDKGVTNEFSIKCAEFNKDVKVTILDLPGQLADAYKNIEAHGFMDRIDGYLLIYLTTQRLTQQDMILYG